MSTAIERAKELLHEDARMDAYHYRFERTDIGAIDRILSEVAIAGKMYHNTGEWGAPYDEVWHPNRVDRRSHEERIQDAASEAAALIRALIALTDKPGDA